MPLFMFVSALTPDHYVPFVNLCTHDKLPKRTLGGSVTASIEVSMTRTQCCLLRSSSVVSASKAFFYEAGAYLPMLLASFSYPRLIFSCLTTH